MDMVFPKAGGLAIVDAIVATAAYTGAKLHLYQNDLTPNPATVLGDLTEATYSGYLAQTITWSAAFFDENDVAASSGGEKLFTKSGATVGDVFGAYLTDTAGAVLLWSIRLDGAPFSFVDDGDTLPLVVLMGAGVGKVTRPAGP